MIGRENQETTEQRNWEKEDKKWRERTEKRETDIRCREEGRDRVGKWNEWA